MDIPSGIIFWENMAISKEMIDWEDFRGSTIVVERVSRSKQSDVYTVAEPCRQDRKGRFVTVLKKFHGGHRLVVSFNHFFKGGEENGVKLPGISEEAQLRYGDRLDI